MIVKFVQIKDDSGYYDPTARVENTNQPGKLVYGFTLRELYIDSHNISHFHVADKFEVRSDEISNQVGLSKDAGYTQLFFKQGPTKNVVVVGSAEAIRDKLEGHSSAGRV